MREIKFRWWNGVKMIEGKNLCVLAKNLKSPEHMQLTGLNDKNGAPIYEGDIIRLFELCDDVASVEWDSDCAAYVINKVKEFAGEPLFEFPEAEVIGNIHMNPELL